MTGNYVLHLYRYTALENTKELLPAIVNALVEITTEREYHADSGAAQILLNSITFEFISSLVITQIVLDVTSSLSQILQGTFICGMFQ